MNVSLMRKLQTLFQKHSQFRYFNLYKSHTNYRISKWYAWHLRSLIRKNSKKCHQDEVTDSFCVRHSHRKLSSSHITTNDVGGSTIFSLSSGHGKCGVAVIRISGPAVATVIKNIAQFEELPIPRKAFLRTLVHPDEKFAIDKGLVLFFPKPQSFTGEDCVEFQVHGGPAVVAALLSALHTVPGCQQAEPGEFTKRAFLNGKLDLTEVEGLGDLIHAETEAQRRQALRQMDGDLARLYSSWRKAIIKCVADLEAFIDFGEEQHIDDSVRKKVYQNVQTLKREITQHVNDNRQGERLREGVHVAIIGEPNVGKSSLLNAICQRPAAIVTSIAGTTRDVIETPINIGGYPVLLCDTAGLRSTQDIVEKEGVTRALKRAQQADIRILVLDLSRFDTDSLSDFDHKIFVAKQLKAHGILLDNNSTEESGTCIPHVNGNKSVKLDNIEMNSGLQESPNETHHLDKHDILNTIVVLNKSDLLTPGNLKRVCETFSVCSFNPENHLNLKKEDTDKVASLSSRKDDSIVCKEATELSEKINLDNGEKTPVAVCCISCIHGDGMENFLSILKEHVADMCGNPLSGHPSLTQARHRSHLMQCLQHLKEYKMNNEQDIVLASQALRFSLWEIGKITGKITSEEILDVIFKDFCIGK